MLNKNISSDKRNASPDAGKKLTGSIAHATDVLICLSKAIHTVTDISRQCHLGKSTVHRVLKLLERSCLVAQDTVDRHYYLGPLIAQLASNPATTHEYMIMYASDEMKRLSIISEETVVLDIMVGTQPFSLHEIPSEHDLKVTQESSLVRPIHAGASAKVLLSQLGDKQLRAVLENTDFTPATERTVTDKGLLMVQIKEIRQQGYAISYGEKISEVMCVSVPVKNYVLPVALSVVGPESRLHPRVKAVVKELKASSSRISGKIG